MQLAIQTFRLGTRLLMLIDYEHKIIAPGFFSYHEGTTPTIQHSVYQDGVLAPKDLDVLGQGL